LGANDFYPTAVSSLKHLLAPLPSPSPSTGASSAPYIITTKGKEFTLKLLERMGVDIPEAHVYGLGRSGGREGGREGGKEGGRRRRM
jgi:hypothetical protein